MLQWEYKIINIVVERLIEGNLFDDEKIKGIL